MGKETVQQFLARVGRDKITKELGHSAQVLTRAVKENKFPPGWFVGVREFCADRGELPPEHLFRWHKGPR